MLTFLNTLWFIRETKAVLFWIYLWQLKEYRFSRLLDHFHTEKGKNLLFNKLIFLKFILILVFFIYPLYSPFILIILYSFEGAKALIDFFKKTLKKPVLTKKAVFLISVALILEISVILILSQIFLFQEITSGSWFAFWLLIFDILTPVITSAIVILFQPLAILGRNQIIKRAIRKREQFKSLLVIGITGSYGKTSTKEFLYAILSEKFNVLKTKEHQNTEIGVSQCVLNDLKPEHQIFIVEMGAYCRGEIKLLCDITKPKIGILTGINEQHMATFGSLENIIKGKYELIESLPKDGIAFFNAQNKYCVELYNKTTSIKKFLYGENVKIFGGENLLVAMAVAKELGMTEEEISKAVEKIENKLPGIQQKRGINGLIIFDATYSANPDSVIGHLEYLKTLRQAQGKLVVVMPCLIELGKATIEVHKRIGQKIGEVCNLAIITTKERFKEIKEGAGEKAIFLENPKEIFEKIKNFCKEGDVVLLESRVPSQLISLLLQ